MMSHIFQHYYETNQKIYLDFFIIGTYVLVEYPKTMGEGRGRPVNKLQTTRKGTMRVVSQQDDTYELLDLVSRKIDTVHVSRIYPFKYDSTKVDPENVLIRDQG